jgi:hypothetical protein
MYIQQKRQGGVVGIIVLVIVILLILPVAAIIGSGVLYVWANSLASDQPEAGSLNNFGAEDAPAFLSGETDDTMIMMSWTYADENLNWAFLSFKLEKGDSVYTCEIATNADGADCLISQTGDSDTQWESDEIVYIKENGANLCESVCNLDIEIIYNGQVLSGTKSVTIA